MKAKSIKGKSPADIQSALQLSMADGYKPSMAIVFISIKQDREAVVEILKKEDIDIIGATSCGEFINGHQDNGTIVILLLNINREAYTILFEDAHNKDLAIVAKKLATDAMQKIKKPAFVLLSTGMSKDGAVFNGEQLMKNLAGEIDPEAHIYGGMAGDDYSFSGSYVFTRDQSTDNGAAALVLDENKLSIQGNAISGWQPVGTVKTVTDCEEEWVLTIDGQPASDLYLKYMGKQMRTDEELKKVYEDVGLLYPFQVIDTDDPIMRSPMMIDKDKKAIKFDFAIPKGTKFQFSMPPDFDIIENVLANAKEIRDTTQFDAEALLIFSCAGRLTALGPLTNFENDGLHEIWKAPMAGFFTYGEFGKGPKARHEFHSTTFCWVAIREK